MKSFKRKAAVVVAASLVATALPMTGVENVKAYEAVTASDEKVSGFNNGKTLDLELFARYNSEAKNKDGGSLEIVEYNSKNGYAYAVSGLKGQIIAVKIAGVTNGEKVANLTGNANDVKDLIKDYNNFSYGDITSVAISPDGTKLAAAVQHENYATPGAVAIFTCEDNGELTHPVFAATGVQPDMVTFADNNTILTADEGEPRNGYGDGAVDPEGTVSIIDLSKETPDSVQVGFGEYNANDLIAHNIIMGVTGSAITTPIAPQYDLEPEYIAVSSDGTTAYVSLQEANAIAVLDVEQAKFTGIYSVGYEDYSTVPIDVVKSDGKYGANTYKNLVGARMPDGIALYEKNGQTYLVTANEGDSREWGEEEEPNYYINEGSKNELTPTSGASINLGAKEAITILDPDKSAV